MQAFAYYLLRPLIFLISKAPFWFLWGVSNFLYVLVFHIVGYRKKVAYENLKNAFPEKSEQEIRKIMRQYYLHMTDLMVETVKMMGISPKEMSKHIQFSDTQIYQELYQQNKGFIIALGHCGNWEWGSACFALDPTCEHDLLVVYKKLSNPFFDKLFLKARTRFGQKAAEMKETLRKMVKMRKSPSVTALIADQRPAPEQAYWTTFLNQDTPFLTGFAKLAQRFEYPLFFNEVQKVKRGYYEIRPIMMAENPKEKTEDELVELFVRHLERQIQENPAYWLWTHKRWKHQRIT